MASETGSPETVADVMRRDVVTVLEHDDLALATQLMLWEELRHLPVVRDQAVVGVLSERDVVGHVAQIAQTGARGRRNVADAMHAPVETIGPGASLAEAAARLAVHKIGCLPVVDGDALVGIVTTTDILAANAWMPIPPPPADDASTPKAPADETVGAVMTAEPVHVRRDASVSDALSVMVQRGVRHLPVVDDRRRVIGVVSDRDVRTLFGGSSGGDGPEGADSGGDADAWTVAQIMTRPVRTVRATDALSVAYRLLAGGQFGALPVVDERDALVGMLSVVDLIRRHAPAGS